MSTIEYAHALRACRNPACGCPDHLGADSAANERRKTTFLFKGTAKQRRLKLRAWFRLLSLRTTNYDLLGAIAALEGEKRKCTSL